MLTNDVTQEPPPDYSSQHQLLDRYLSDESDPVAALRRYFRQEGPPKALFGGRQFERFPGGGDAAEFRNVVTAADILALNFLSIKDRLGEFAVDVMAKERADKISILLAQLPIGRDMHVMEPDLYRKGAPPWELWDLLLTCGGKHMPVYTSKLMARKRPRLIPVFDSTIARLLNYPQSYWMCLWTWFNDNPDRVTRLTNLRTEAGDIEDISLLRCLDAILWLRAARSY